MFRFVYFFFLLFLWKFIQNSSSTFHDNILWANGFVILYDLCDKSSFQVAQQYLELVNSMRGFVHSPILLLANKRDLEQGRKVSLMEGRNLAAKYGAHFFEVRTKDSTHLLSPLISMKNTLTASQLSIICK